MLQSVRWPPSSRHLRFRRRQQQVVLAQHRQRTLVALQLLPSSQPSQRSDAPARRSSADGAPPPHPCSPAPALVRPPASGDPSPAACPAQQLDHRPRARLLGHAAPSALPQPVETLRPAPALPPLLQRRRTGQRSRLSLQHVQVMLQIQHLLVAPEAALVPRHALPLVPDLHIGRQQSRLAVRLPVSAASSSSWCAPSRSPCHPPSGNWSRPARSLRSPSGNRCSRSTRMRFAHRERLARDPPLLVLPAAAQMLVQLGQVLHAAASAPGGCAGSSPPRLPRRPSRCPAPDCRTPSESPSASGTRSAARSPPAGARAGSSSPRSSGCRSAAGGTLRRNSEMPARGLPESLLRGVVVGHMKGAAAGHRCASRRGAPSGARRRSRPPPRTNPPAPRRPTHRLRHERLAPHQPQLLPFAAARTAAPSTSATVASGRSWRIRCQIRCAVCRCLRGAC